MEKDTCTKTCDNKDISIETDHTFLTTDEKLDYLIGESYITLKVNIKHFFIFYIFLELQKLSVKKENVIVLKINALHNRLNELKAAERNQDKIENNDEDDDTVTSLLPIKDSEQMNNFEEKLKNKEFYTKVVCTFIYFNKLIIF